ncbi:MAG: hypothetical protein ACR2ML_03120 [Solirubrobacteraceae bacterium]
MGAVGHNVALVLRAAAILLGAFALATVVAELVGAVNLGTAATFGQLAFLATLVCLLIRD